MATLSELVQTVAEVEGIDPATVGLIARHLREGGLIASGGRGLSAARMTVTDAANLLIGVNATSSAVDAPPLVPVYRRLRVLDSLSFSDHSSGTFGEALEQLLAAAGCGQWPERFLGSAFEDLDFKESFARGEVQIELRFRKSPSVVYLVMNERPGRDLPDPRFAENWLAVVSGKYRLQFVPQAPRGPPRKRKVGDRIEDTSIGYATLRAVGQLIS